MPVDFHIAIPSAGRIIRVLQRLRRLADRDLYAQIGDQIVKRTKARFKTKTSPEGQRWKDWSDAYAATRPAGKSLLIDEGDLERSIESRVAGDRLQVYSTEPHAAAVNHRRVFFGISSSDETEIMDLIESSARRACSGA